MSTRVIQLGTKRELYFGCPPAQAVVCAYEQSKGNYNTWGYDYSQARIGKSGKTVHCGDFSAMLEVK